MEQLHLYISMVLARNNKSYSGFEIIVVLTHSLDHIKQNLPNEKPLPARASEQGNVIGSVRIYIYIYMCVYKKNCN